MKIHPSCIDIVTAEIKTIIIPTLIQTYWDEKASSDAIYKAFFKSALDHHRDVVKNRNLTSAESSYVHRKDYELSLIDAVTGAKPTQLPNSDLIAMGMPIIEYKLKEKALPVKKTQIYNVFAGLLGESSFSSVKATTDPYAKPMLLGDLLAEQSKESREGIAKAIINRFLVSPTHKEALLDVFESLVGSDFIEADYDAELLGNGFYGLAALLAWGSGYIFLNHQYDSYFIDYVDDYPNDTRFHHHEIKSSSNIMVWLDSIYMVPALR